MKPLLRLFGCCVAACLAASCSSSAHMVVRDNADYSVTAEFIPSALLEKNITRLLKQKGNQDAEQSVFNSAELKASLTEAGITVKDITLKGAMGLSAACTLPYNHELLKDLIRYDRIGKTVLLRISPENISAFLEAVPQESRDFIDLFMAPLFTGDKMPLAEYEELIGAAYGKRVAAELRKAEFVLTVDVPYRIQTARIHPIGAIAVPVKTDTNSRASVRIPLLELLCTVGTIEAQLTGNS